MNLLQDQVRRLQERLEFIEDSKIFQDPDSPSSFGSAHVPHQSLITSSSREPSRKSRIERNTREDMSIPGNVFDCQPARRDPDDERNNSSNVNTIHPEPEIHEHFMIQKATEQCAQPQAHSHLH